MEMKTGDIDTEENLKKLYGENYRKTHTPLSDDEHAHLSAMNRKDRRAALVKSRRADFNARERERGMIARTPTEPPIQLDLCKKFILNAGHLPDCMIGPSQDSCTCGHMEVVRLLRGFSPGKVQSVSVGPTND